MLLGCAEKKYGRIFVASPFRKCTLGKLGKWDMCGVFWLKYTKPSSGAFRVPNKSCHVSCINSLFMSVYVAEISTSHSSSGKMSQNY